MQKNTKAQPIQIPYAKERSVGNVFTLLGSFLTDLLSYVKMSIGQYYATQKENENRENNKEISLEKRFI